jgi:hypothetical protein
VGIIVAVEICERQTVGVFDAEATGDFDGGPGRGEGTGNRHSITLYSKVGTNQSTGFLFADHPRNTTFMINTTSVSTFRRQQLCCFRNRERKEAALFAIDWLRRGIPVERETSVLANTEDAIAAARARADVVTTRHPGQEPDSFRLIDATGKIVGRFSIHDGKR